MSNTATQFSSEGTQYAVLVVGELDDEQHELLKQKMEILSRFVGGRPHLAISIEERALQVQSARFCHSYASPLAEYLQAFSRMLATNVVVRKVFSSDPDANIKNAFLLVLPDTPYEVLGSETDNPNVETVLVDWSNRNLHTVPVDELRDSQSSGIAVLSDGVYDTLRRVNINTVGELVRQTENYLFWLPSIMGAVNLRNITEALAARNLSLRADD